MRVLKVIVTVPVLAFCTADVLEAEPPPFRVLNETVILPAPEFTAPWPDWALPAAVKVLLSIDTMPLLAF